MKRKIISASTVITLVLLSLTLASCTVNEIMEDEITTVYISGSELWIFDNIAQMNTQTTDIVRAKILNSRVEPINTLLRTPRPDDDMEIFYIIHTIYQLKVLEVFKGDLAVGDVLEVAQMGGLYGNRKLVFSNQLSMNRGDEFIFFLHSYDAYGFGHLPMTIAGSYQGVFHTLSLQTTQANEMFENITEAYFENHLSPNETLESVSPHTSLTLTIGDLMQIRYDSGLE